MGFLQDVVLRQPRLLEQVFEYILGLDEDKDLVTVSHQVFGHILIEVKMSGMAQLDKDIHGNFTNAVPSINKTRFSS